MTSRPFMTLTHPSSRTMAWNIDCNC